MTLSPDFIVKSLFICMKFFVCYIIGITVELSSLLCYELYRKNGEILTRDMLQYGASKPSIDILTTIAGPLDPTYYLNNIQPPS